MLSAVTAGLIIAATTVTAAAARPARDAATPGGSATAAPAPARTAVLINGDRILAGPGTGRGVTVTNYYTDPSIANPIAITTGPDGALWFDNDNPVGSVGRITTTGQVSTYGSGIAYPNAIAAGPGGALWTISFRAEIVRGHHRRAGDHLHRCR